MEDHIEAHASLIQEEENWRVNANSEGVTHFEIARQWKRMVCTG